MNNMHIHFNLSTFSYHFFIYYSDSNFSCPDGFKNPNIKNSIDNAINRDERIAAVLNKKIFTFS